MRAFKYSDYMSCQDCKDIQDHALDKNVPTSPPLVYVRVDNANVVVLACNKHAKMVIDKLRDEINGPNNIQPDNRPAI